MTTYKMIDIEGVGETYATKSWKKRASRILPIC